MHASGNVKHSEFEAQTLAEVNTHKLKLKRRRLSLL